MRPACLPKHFLANLLERHYFPPGLHRHPNRALTGLWGRPSPILSRQFTNPVFFSEMTVRTKNHTLFDFSEHICPPKFVQTPSALGPFLATPLQPRILVC